jgi:hypothetical protein
VEELFRSYAANEALHELELQLEAMRNWPTPEEFERTFRAAKRFARVLDDDDEDRLDNKQWGRAQAMIDALPRDRYEEDDDFDF